MNPTIIFDMDGVMVKSEDVWDECEQSLFPRLFGPNIAQKLLGNTRGSSESQIYEMAKNLGYKGAREILFDSYDKVAQTLYLNAPLTIGLDELLGTLELAGVRLGLVSASPKNWIEIVIGRLKHGNAFRFIESVNDHPELAPKPAPDGYNAAMKALGSTNSETLIIEDSQTGINAAIASGAHVCCFTMHHDGKSFPSAALYAHSIKDLQHTCETFIAHCRLGSAFP